MTDSMKSVTRRNFLKSSGALGVLAVAGASVAMPGFGEGPARAFAEEAEEKIVWGHCAINCPSQCALKIHVKDDEIVMVDADTDANRAFDDPSSRPCQRGRSYRRWANDPNRLKYPLKRVGARGEGKFEQISWEEAVDIIAENYSRIREEYGNESIHCCYATGANSTTSYSFRRLMNCLGGYVDYYGSYSTAQITAITSFVFGTPAATGSTFSAAQDAELVLMFGNNPVETRQSGGASHYDYVKMRERTKGRIIVVDPRMSDTLSGHSDEWIPINPGTDAALCSALAHELIANGMMDKEFLDTYCVGYDDDTMPDSAKGQHRSYKDYIMGTGYDMVEKTPEWAAGITGVPADKIRELAFEVGTAKPLFVAQGWGLQRRFNGENAAWSIIMLPLLTGQIGLPGTNNGCGEGVFSAPANPRPFIGENPVKTMIPCFSFIDAIDHGSEMTASKDGVRGADKLSTNIKFLMNYAGNCLTNQNGDINRAHDILVDESKCEFILGIDVSMCDSAKYADVLLPDSFRFEQDSYLASGGDVAHLMAGSPCTSLKFERKTAYEMCSMIAERLGVLDAFTEGKTEAEWIKELYEQDRAAVPIMPEYDELKAAGVMHIQNPEGAVIALKGYREDPKANPLPTPSGKIEIYSEALATLAETWELRDDQVITPVATYFPELYGVETRTDQYPLLCMGYHGKARIHSSWGNVELLKEVNPQQVWINEEDANARGIAPNDLVRVFNDYGETRLTAKVTPRIVPGTVAIPQGAWHDADMNGDRVDRGGCINVLTTHLPSPLAKGNPQHSNICQVEKVGA